MLGTRPPVETVSMATGMLGWLCGKVGCDKGRINVLSVDKRNCGKLLNPSFDHALFSQLYYSSFVGPFCLCRGYLVLI